MTVLQILRSAAPESYGDLWGLLDAMEEHIEAVRARYRLDCGEEEIRELQLDIVETIISTGKSELYRLHR